MMLSQLILTLLAGGLLAWLSERRGAAWPRQVALLTLLAALVELAAHAAIARLQRGESALVNQIV